MGARALPGGSCHDGSSSQLPKLHAALLLHPRHTHCQTFHACIRLTCPVIHGMGDVPDEPDLPVLIGFGLRDGQTTRIVGLTCSSAELAVIGLVTRLA